MFHIFQKQLGLDANFTSWDLKIRIPRRKLRIYIVLFPGLNSQIQTKTPQTLFLIGFGPRPDFFNCFIGLSIKHITN